MIKYHVLLYLGSLGRPKSHEVEPSFKSDSDKGYYLIVADTGNSRVQILSAVTGQFVRLIGGTVKGGRFQILNNFV